MNMPLLTPNLSAFFSARSFFAAGKLAARYFLIAASEEPLRSLRPTSAALISSEYLGPSAAFLVVDFLFPSVCCCCP